MVRREQLEALRGDVDAAMAKHFELELEAALQRMRGSYAPYAQWVRPRPQLQASDLQRGENSQLRRALVVVRVCT